jgi:CubicO group peptidase (beta-lactamase class C family)
MSIADALVEQSSGRQLYGHPSAASGGGRASSSTPAVVPDAGPAHAGHDGAGGQMAFADADAGIGFAFLTNQMGGPDDDRTRRIVAALDEAIRS